MSRSTIQENTLGIAVGREGKAKRERRLYDRRPGFRRPERTVKTTRANQNGLGGRHLGIGMVFAGGVIAVFLLWRFTLQWAPSSLPSPSLVAWIILGAASVGALLIAQQRPSRPPRWMFATAMVAGAVVVVLDLVGCWGLADSGVYPTAAPAVGALLTGFVTLRETRDILVASGILGGAMFVVALLGARSDPLTLAPDILAIALAVVPPVLGVAIVRAFRRMVQLELDLVLVQSTVSQPRDAVGMLASEQLAKLDLDAERLLDGVAEERIPLPLDQETSTTAASLATQLRLHLIEGRTETWLHHAITESEFLAPAVDLRDPSGLAGLLAPAQRDALLLTLWLLIGDATRTSATVRLTLGPISPTHGFAGDRSVRFPIELTTTGVPRRRVDPETWEAIRVVGPHVDAIRDGSLRVDIECRVDNPADA
ncbi:hypothetical protein [Glaciibacter sp. 2TAF33]|uniref:hypothetical protein n=1 Tax=Glaciibacter sp. 2TAF33 TaxID=3233015 RepID=UPI003F90C783